MLKVCDNRIVPYALFGHFANPEQPAPIMDAWVALPPLHP
jgi:hypothetical protein